jgi:kanamycin kinase
VSGPPFLSGPPTEEVRTPYLVRECLNDDDEVRAVWRNEMGGITFRAKPGRATPCSPEYFQAGAVRFVKYSPPEASAVLPLSREAERMKWARPFTPVPQVLDYVLADDGSEVLVTSQIIGRPAVHPYWKGHRAEAASVIGEGLRDLHEALPVDECPFTWSISERLERLSGGGLPGAGLPASEVETLLAEAPELDLVVCHGDACAPNTLITNFGHLAGHVDLGELGVADRWADLAVAAMSVTWNFGAGYEHLVYQGYGIEPDQAKIDYYRRLWQAGDMARSE